MKPTDKILNANKTSFDLTVRSARWISTNGLKLFLQFYYSKTPMFELPPGWVPYYVEWVLSFPRAPLGTISIQVWSTACATAIALIGELLAASLAYARTRKAQAVPAASGSTADASKKAQ